MLEKTFFVIRLLPHAIPVLPWLMADLKLAIDNRIKDYKESNDRITADIVSTERLNIEKYKGQMTVTPPTQGDLRWAKKINRAPANIIEEALDESIKNHSNWRVWFLITRPYRHTQTLGHGSRGFRGNVTSNYLLSTAAKYNNITAAYLLFKFAEHKPTIHFGESPEICRNKEIQHYYINALSSAARYGHDTFFNFCVDTHAKGNIIKEARSWTRQSMIEDLIRIRKTNLLDVMAENGTPAKDFTEGLAQTFGPSNHSRWDEVITRETRAVFIGWAHQRGLIDQDFIDAMPARERAEAEAIAAAKADGSYFRPVRGGTYIEKTPACPENWQIDYVRIDDSSIVADISKAEEWPAVVENGIRHTFNFVARTVTADNRTQSMDDYAKGQGHEAEVISRLEESWEWHKPLRRLPRPRKSRVVLG